MPNVYEFQGLVPVIHPTAYVHPAACLIGDVIVGPRVYIAPFASLRGDFGRLIVEEEANVQDHCTLHGFPDRDTIVEKHGHVGHGAIIHGAIVRRGALIGMNSVLLDFCEIGEESIVAAGAVVKANEIVPRRTLMAGIPAKAIRSLGDKDAAWKIEATRDYINLARASRQTLKAAQPLTAPEPNRKRTTVCESRPKHTTKG